MEVRTEELVKELNTLKATKKTDAFIANHIKEQEAAVKIEVGNTEAEEAKLDM